MTSPVSRVLLRARNTVRGAMLPASKGVQGSQSTYVEKQVSRIGVGLPLQAQMDHVDHAEIHARHINHDHYLPPTPCIIITLTDMVTTAA